MFGHKPRIKALRIILREDRIRRDPFSLEGVDIISCFARLGGIVAEEFDKHPDERRWSEIYIVPCHEWWYIVHRSDLPNDIKLYLHKVDERSLVRKLWRPTRYYYQKRGLRGASLIHAISKAVAHYGYEAMGSRQLEAELNQRIADGRENMGLNVGTLREMRIGLLRATADAAAEAAREESQEDVIQRIEALRELRAEMLRVRIAVAAAAEEEREAVEDLRVSDFAVACEATGEDCPICQESMEGEVLKVEGCGHVFCEECLGKWVVNGVGATRACPVCKAAFVPRSD